MKTMLNPLKNFFKRLVGESQAIKDSSINRLSIPLHIYPLALKYHGKILTKDELTLSSDQLNYLIKENYLIKIPSIQQSSNDIECLRCMNTLNDFFAEITCKRCNNTHLYCRKCIDMNRVLACESLYYWHDNSVIFAEKADVNQWQGKLTKPQQKASDKAVDAFRRQTNKLIWAVTGSGKTEIIFPVIAAAIEGGMRVCISSPRADVVKELRLRIDSVFKNTSIAALYAGSEERLDNAQLIIATNHQLLRFKRTFDLLIIDEVDAFPYSINDRLKRITERARKKEGTTLYLTATPNSSLKKLPTVFIPTRFHGHSLPIPQLKYSYRLNKYLKDHTLPREFNDILKSRLNPQRQLLIFVPTIELTIQLPPLIAQILIQNNLIKNKNTVQSVHASDHDRNEKVDAFRNKQLYCLVTTTILERGVTFPSVDVIVIQADNRVFNRAGLVQISGRVGRSPHDPSGDLYFLINHKTEAIKQCIIELKHMNHLAKELI